MKKSLCIFLILFLLPLPVRAEGLEAPPVPSSAERWMPDTHQNLGQGIWEIIRAVLPSLRPDLAEALRTALAAVVSVMLLSMIQIADHNQYISELVGTVSISVTLLASSRSLIVLGRTIVEELSEYSKLLTPALTAALAAQGAPASSAALYLGTAAFTAFLSNLLRRFALPSVYLFLAIATASGAIEENALKEIKQQILKFVVWLLKSVLTLFISYMSITGVVSGTTDAAALKVTKTAISSVVPVIGSTLANASEAVLMGAAIAKNTMGIYGIYAIAAIFLAPFLRIGVHYCILKGALLVCSLFPCKRQIQLISDYSSAMGLLLAMTASLCIMLLVSTICFLKGGGL